MNAAPFALSPLAASSRASSSLPLALIASLFLSRSSSPTFFAVSPLCRIISLSDSPSPPPSNVLRQARAAFSCERPSPPTSFRRLRSRSSLSPPPPPSSFSSHSYSCSGNSMPPARRRTLLHFLRAFSPPRGNDASNASASPSFLSPTLPLIRFPHPAAAAAVAASSFDSTSRVSAMTHTTPASFTIASPRIIRGRITQFSRRGSLSVVCARGSLQIISRKLSVKTPRKETSIEGLRSRLRVVVTKLHRHWICVKLCMLIVE